MKNGFYWVRPRIEKARWAVARIIDGNISFVGTVGGGRISADGEVRAYSLGEMRSNYYDLHPEPIMIPPELQSPDNIPPNVCNNCGDVT